MHKKEKDKPWHIGTHLRVLSESYPMDTNMTGFRWFSKIFASLYIESIEKVNVLLLMDGQRGEKSNH